MTDNLSLAKSRILEPAGLTETDLESVLGSMLSNQVDAADLYFQSSCFESWQLEDDIIKSANYSVDHGVGVRAVSSEKTGFAYSDDIILAALNDAAGAAKSIAKSGGEHKVQAWSNKILQPHELYAHDSPLKSITDSDKVALLHSINKVARAVDPKIKRVDVSLAGAHHIILVAASDGTLVADVRPIVRLNVTAIAENGDRRERGSYGGGGRLDYQHFIKNDLGTKYAKEAARQALLNLDAIPSPAGNMPVVLGHGWPGILLHEAVGHGLEGDFNRKGSSAYSGRIGERVASPLCTIVDDGTIAGRRGSLNIDDEGVKTQCTTLIEKGILKGYMQDKLNAKLMGTTSTGNGRRESYAHVPMPRMTNTYMLAGESDPQEIIASVDKGLYAVGFSGGQVDITTGNFVFSSSEAYLIENGKITKPVKGASIVGNGPDVMTKVSKVGNDLELDAGVGVCGKEGQYVPVGVGQPTLLIDEITVGGTS